MLLWNLISLVLLFSGGCLYSFLYKVHEEIKIKIKYLKCFFFSLDNFREFSLKSFYLYSCDLPIWMFLNFRNNVIGRFISTSGRGQQAGLSFLSSNWKHQTQRIFNCPQICQSFTAGIVIQSFLKAYFYMIRVGLSVCLSVTDSSSTLGKKEFLWRFTGLMLNNYMNHLVRRLLCKGWK